MSNLKYCSGDLLGANVDALVNTVNLRGVMGKGIALQFRKQYPDNYIAYRAAYMAGELSMGQMFVFERLSQCPRYIVNFPTKAHWRSRSRFDDIENGLRNLVGLMAKLEISSIAVPALGYGLGGLDWSTVEPLIELHLGQLASVEVLIYPPQ